ncbi:MAG TPA: AmmeMemoRadiSam system protein B [Desulfuromonadales bacterium]|nr:AmmeMemoRadiSam system protein B [Desulfuromonadales bacterium]
MQRQPSVAGQFYPGSSQQLRAVLSEMLPESGEKQKVFGIIVPHAGYVYSGAIAGELYAKIEIPSTVLVICPNHHGAGAAAALYPEGEWLTPLGATSINSRLNALLQKHVPLVQLDDLAHQREHSLEVQLPFLQYLRPDVSIAALCLGRGDYPVLKLIGEGVAAAIREYGDDVLIVASSDMSHYEASDVTRDKDRAALERAVAFDTEGLLEVCRSRRITMCGVVPSVIMLEAARSLGATEAKLVRYGTSGDVTGDDRQVVGYAAVLVR